MREIGRALLAVVVAALSGVLHAQRAAGAEAAGGALTTVAQIRALPAGEAERRLPVELHAILTYYQPAEGLIFVQDATGGIFVVPPVHPAALKAGDAVVVRGVTVPSFETNIEPAAIEFAGRGAFPRPAPVNWRKLLQMASDCRYVSITGRVRSATRQDAAASGSGGTGGKRHYLLLDLETDGGMLRVHMEHPDGVAPLALLDAKVRIDGVAGGAFDGKFQRTGAELWVSGASHMQVLERAAEDPMKLPLTPIAKIMSASYVHDESQRVHVRGTVTLYQPGIQLVVETPNGDAVLVNTHEQFPLLPGQRVDVLGFPDPHGYSEILREANVLPRQRVDPLEPRAVAWDEAMEGRYPYDLIALTGRVAAEVHERHQDTLVIETGAHAFSAILSRTVWNRDFDRVALPRYPVGSTVRVSGVCFVHAGGPWNTERWFDLQLRSPADVVVLEAPPWWTVRHLLYVSATLLALMLGALIWAVLLQRKVRRQTEQIRLTMEKESARERRVALLEKERGRVLEAINSMQDLDEVVEMILRLISTQLEGRSCWCELEDGRRVGAPATETVAGEPVRREIFSGGGERLGTLVIACAGVQHSHAGEVMEMGASLIALAVDRRRLYETLIHRSQYDQLTNAANRFLLETRLDEALDRAGRTRGRCGLVYIDLDHFKQVNDLYGHRTGDLFLQEVTQRFSASLRGMDTLARVGGDEFIALVPVVRSRAEMEEIAQRLLRSFDAPFRIEGRAIMGSASIGIAVYPDDGLTKDELKRVADTAMYAQKPGMPAEPE